MSIITLWNSDRDQSGVTISTVAIATKMAIERNLKVLIISTACDDFTIKNCFWKDNSVKKRIMQGKNLAVENGVEGLARLITSNKISPSDITDYTHVIFRNTLEILEGYVGSQDKTVEENIRDYKNVSQIYPALITIANQYYDMVFVDLSRELNEKVRDEILELSNLNIYVATQKITSLDKYIEMRNQKAILKGPKNLIIVGRYNGHTKFNRNNLQKYLEEKKELMVVPYNTLLFEAAEETTVVDMFLRLSKIRDTSDTNYIFMVEVGKIVDKIIERLKDLQVRMR